MATAMVKGAVRLSRWVADHELFERRQCAGVASYRCTAWGCDLAVQVAKFGWNLEPVHRNTRHQHMRSWKTSFALNTDGSPAPDAMGQERPNGDTPEPSSTRLGIIVRAASKLLLDRLNAARKNFPLKVFLLLLGFYTANALATILGQTGDWDVLVAGIVVAAIEGIGMLMYKKPMSSSSGRMQSLVVMVNFWKAGVCLGLFVDAFKLGS